MRKWKRFVGVCVAGMLISRFLAKAAEFGTRVANNAYTLGDYSRN